MLCNALLILFDTIDAKSELRELGTKPKVAKRNCDIKEFEIPGNMGIEFLECL